MAGISETRTWESLLTTTAALYRKQMIDNIFDVAPLLSWVTGKLGDKISRKNKRSMKRVEKGGESIVEHLMYGTNSTTKPYSGHEVFDTTPQEGMTIARYAWKYYGSTVSMSGGDLRANRGESALIKLMKAKFDQCELSLRDTLNTDLFLDGTGSSSKALLGLNALVSSTVTIGGLAPTTFAWWKSSVTASAGSFAANGIQKMRTTMNTLTFGSDSPDLILCDQTTYESYEAKIGDSQRIIDMGTADLGFESLTYKKIPVIFDRDCQAGTMYFLNSNYLNWVVMEGADMEIREFKQAFDSDSYLAPIILQAAFTTNNRRKLGVITGFTA